MLCGVNTFSKFQLPISYCLWFTILEEKADWLNYETVCRTAPTTTGLFKRADLQKVNAEKAMFDTKKTQSELSLPSTIYCLLYTVYCLLFSD